MRGDFGRGFWAGRSASRHLDRATEYSRELYEYSRSVPRVEPAIAQPDSELIGHNIAAAKKDLKVIRQDASENQEMVKRLDAVEKHLVAADKHFKELHGECCKEDANSDVAMSCCNELIKELEKANAEHDALLRAMQAKSAAPNEGAK